MPSFDEETRRKWHQEYIDRAFKSTDFTNHELYLIKDYLKMAENSLAEERRNLLFATQLVELSTKNIHKLLLKCEGFKGVIQSREDKSNE